MTIVGHTAKYSFRTRYVSQNHPYASYLLNIEFTVPMITLQLEKEHGVSHSQIKWSCTGHRSHGLEQHLSIPEPTHLYSTHLVGRHMLDAQFPPWNTCQVYLK